MNLNYLSLPTPNSLSLTCLTLLTTLRTFQVDELSERSDSELDDLYNLNNFKDDILFKDYDPATDDDEDGEGASVFYVR